MLKDDAGVEVGTNRSRAIGVALLEGRHFLGAEFEGAYVEIVGARTVQ
jgi:hypothetical protein